MMRRSSARERRRVTQRGVGAVGDDEYAGSRGVDAALRRRELPDVHFAGYLHGTALAAAYAAADVFLFPSDTETFGNVVFEAMASGVPVVSTHRGGVVDTVVPGRNGLRAPAGDADAFAAAALRLLEEEGFRAQCAAAARADAASKSWTCILDGLRDGYREAVRREAVRAA